MDQEKRAAQMGESPVRQKHDTKNSTDARNNNNIAPPTLDSLAALEMEERWTEMPRRQSQKLRVSSRKNSLATVAATVEAAVSVQTTSTAFKPTVSYTLASGGTNTAQTSAVPSHTTQVIPSSAPQSVPSLEPTP